MKYHYEIGEYEGCQVVRCVELDETMLDTGNDIARGDQLADCMLKENSSEEFYAKCNFVPADESKAELYDAINWIEIGCENNERKI